MRWHSSGQSCIKPCIGVPSSREISFVLKPLARIFFVLVAKVKSKG